MVLLTLAKLRRDGEEPDDECAGARARCWR
jgi:hypothetical protein